MTSIFQAHRVEKKSQHLKPCSFLRREDSYLIEASMKVKDAKIRHLQKCHFGIKIIFG